MGNTLGEQKQTSYIAMSISLCAVDISWIFPTVGEIQTQISAGSAQKSIYMFSILYPTVAKQKPLGNAEMEYINMFLFMKCFVLLIIATHQQSVNWKRRFLLDIR